MMSSANRNGKLQIINVHFLRQFFLHSRPILSFSVFVANDVPSGCPDLIKWLKSPTKIRGRYPAAKPREKIFQSD